MDVAPGVPLPRDAWGPDDDRVRLDLALVAGEVGCFDWDVTSDTLRWDPALLTIFGLDAAEFSGRIESFFAAVAEEDRERVRAELDRVVRTRGRLSVGYRIHRPDGSERWIEARGRVVTGEGGDDGVYIVGAAIDNTELHTAREHADEERNRLLAGEKAARSRLAFLAEASGRFTAAQRREDLLDALARMSVPSLGDWCSVYVPDGDVLVRVAVAHADPSLDPLAQSLRGAHPVPVDGTNHIARVYRTRTPVVLPDIDAELLEEVAVTSAYARAVHVLGLHGGMAFPVVARGRCLAVVSFLLGTVGRRFADDDVLLAGELLNRAGAALDTLEQLERQTTVAQALQAAVLPARLPDVAGLDIGAAYRPATAGDEAGGDWYDAFRLPDDRVGVVVGDVAGHGLPAAALMGQLRNALRAYAVEGAGPAATLKRLDRLLGAFEPDAMATVVYAEIDRDRSVVTLASAGHPPVVHVAPDGTASLVDVESASPLGAPTGQPLADRAIAVAPGARLLLYSDGLVERRDTNIDVGLARLLIAAEAVAGGDAGGAQESCERVLRMLLATGHEDDACLLVVHVGAE